MHATMERTRRRSQASAPHAQPESTLRLGRPSAQSACPGIFLLREQAHAPSAQPESTFKALGRPSAQSAWRGIFLLRGQAYARSVHQESTRTQQCQRSEKIVRKESTAIRRQSVHHAQLAPAASSSVYQPLRRAEVACQDRKRKTQAPISVMLARGAPSRTANAKPVASSAPHTQVHRFQAALVAAPVVAVTCIIWCLHTTLHWPQQTPFNSPPGPRNCLCIFSHQHMEAAVISTAAMATHTHADNTPLRSGTK